MLKLFLRYSNVVCAIFIVRIFSSAETIPSDAYFDGVTLTIPYLEVSGIQYEVKLIPSTNSVLTHEDCPILCLEVLSAADSMISSPRDPATFDGLMLNTPRVAVGNEIYTGSFRYLDQYKNAYFFSAVSAQLAPFFSSTDRQSWTSDEIEARFDFCKNNSSRQIAPAPFADINKDGFQDILVPFSCYQDKLPKFDGGVNNAKVKSGMVLFCSDEVGEYRDCSMDIFGGPYIDTSEGGPGGLYYIHNAEEPTDLNNDGYLDYALNLSRDDGVGRQSYDVTNDYGRILAECFDGNESLALEYTGNDLSNCAYFSDQYVFLSRGDGTYSNVKLPWKANWTHAMRSIPNEVGGYDLISIGYGEVEVARINGTEAFDIKETYESFSNFSFATGVSPYGVYYLEFENIGYWITEGIQPQFVDNVAEYSEFKLETGFDGTIAGITVWKWNPGIGFEFSDYYLPSPSSFFNFINESGQIETGMYKRGVPQLDAAMGNSYNFMKKATLDPSEGEILIVQGESNGFLKQTNRTIPDGYRPSYDQLDKSNLEDVLFPVQVIEGFIISDGKILPRERSVVEGDILFNSPGFYFRDINDDGFDDMITITGMRQSGSVYLNTGEGYLKRVDTNAIKPSVDLKYSGGIETMFWPLQNNGTLDLIAWEKGMNFRPDFWNIENDNIFRAGDFSIIRGNYSISELPTTSIRSVVDAFFDCAEKSTGWIWNCPY